MGKIRRKFDVQFKTKVCQSIEAGVCTVLDICREHQLQRPVVEGWLKRYTSGTLVAATGNRERELERENEKLRAKIGELTMTIDLLKKVEAWKRQQRSEGSSIITSRNLAQFQKPAKPLALPAPATITGRNGTR
jgi:transposase-like protein